MLKCEQVGFQTLDWSLGEDLGVDNWHQVNWESHERGAMMRSRRNNQIRKQLEGRQSGTSGANRKGNLVSPNAVTNIFNLGTSMCYLREDDGLQACCPSIDLECFGCNQQLYALGTVNNSREA